MTKSYVIDPETGKMLSAQEWKDKMGDKVTEAKMVAIVPEDGTPFAFPVEVFDDRDWSAAMELAEGYKAPHAIEGSDGTFTLPTRKQGIDFRAASESGLWQLLEMIGANELLDQLKNNWTWTREKYIPRGTSEVRWSCVCYSSSLAWLYYGGGLSLDSGFSGSSTVRPVTLLHLES